MLTRGKKYSFPKGTFAKVGFLLAGTLIANVFYAIRVRKTGKAILGSEMIQFLLQHSATYLDSCGVCKAVYLFVCFLR